LLEASTSAITIPHLTILFLQSFAWLPSHHLKEFSSKTISKKYSLITPNISTPPNAYPTVLLFSYPTLLMLTVCEEGKTMGSSQVLFPSYS
jgi:hypothetical protein